MNTIYHNSIFLIDNNSGVQFIPVATRLLGLIIKKSMKNQWVSIYYPTNVLLHEDYIARAVSPEKKLVLFVKNRPSPKRGYF